MQGIKKSFLAVFILGISIMGGCTPNTVNEEQNKKEVSADVVKNSSIGVSRDLESSNPVEQQEENAQLAWRIEKQTLDDSVRSYLYLQSVDNEAIAVELGYLVGEVFDLKEYKDRYPEGGIIPINSWYGGAGVEVVGRYLDGNALSIMVSPIGDGLEYGSSWEDYEEWYRVDISYDEQGKIAHLSAEEVMNLNNIIT